MTSVLWELYPPTVDTDLGRASMNPNNQTDPEQDDKEGPLLPIKTLKQTIASFLNEPLVEVLDCALVLASSLFVAISTVDALPASLGSILLIAQDVVAGIFVLEFFARWFCSSAPRGLHFTQPLILVDVFVVLIPFLVTTTGTEWLPAWLTSSTSLINLRLLRILRLQRVLQNMQSFTRFERALGIPAGNVKTWQLQLARVILSVFTLVSVATGLIYTVEHKVNPQISDYFTALYFGLTTLTTVGFGDITPVTWQGKLVVSLSIMAGVTVIPAQGAALIDALLERQREKESVEASAMASENISANNNRISQEGKSYQANGSNKLGTKQLLTQRWRPEQPTANGRLTLETAFFCSACGACMHWSSAKYCWQCGRGLPSEKDLVGSFESSTPADASEYDTVASPVVISRPSQSSFLSLGEESEQPISDP
jgi:voltage-gated potassium channel Kch